MRRAQLGLTGRGLDQLCAITVSDHKDVDTSGVVAITGFRIEYVRVPCPLNTCLPDNHILRFGYRLTTTGVDVAFHDNEPDTDWKYQLNFARFK
jgi:hypothetical protein